MKTLSALVSSRSALIKIFLVCLATTMPEAGFARKELPFCPGGGPPGWMNYFDYKRDQNIWRQQNYQPYSNHPSSYSGYNRYFSHNPSYFAPYLLAPEHQAQNPLAR